MATASAFTLVPASWDIAQAGGNGGGNGGVIGGDNGHGNSGRASGNREAASTPTNGSIASELKGLNAAHANDKALENAAPNSMPGKLASYRDTTAAAATAQDDVIAAEDALTAAEQELDRLGNLSDEDIAAEFPDDDYDDAVTAAENDVETAAGNLSDAEEALDDLTGGRELSSEAMDQLNDLLSMDQ